jgi:NNP family nitrate/nitrite transporter-like MFS transporter
MGVLRSERLTWLFSLFYFLTFGGFVAFSLYLPKLLIDLYKITPIDAGNRVLVFVLLATLARPTGGWLSDRRGAARVLQAVFLVISLMALILALTTALIPMTIACLVASVFLDLGSGAVFKLVPEYFAGRTGTVTGIVGAAGGLGGFFPPLILGAVRQAFGSYTVGFALLALTSLLCFLLNQRILVSDQAGRLLRHAKMET